jgi:hypothetical protein
VTRSTKAAAAAAKAALVPSPLPAKTKHAKKGVREVDQDAVAVPDAMMELMENTTAHNHNGSLLVQRLHFAQSLLGASGKSSSKTTLTLSTGDLLGRLKVNTYSEQYLCTFIDQ